MELEFCLLHASSIYRFEYLRSVALWRWSRLSQRPFLRISLETMPRFEINSQVTTVLDLMLSLALYKGYKLRNARLDALVKSPPGFLANNSIPLANQTFTDVKSDSVLRELHTHLALRHALLDRVIRARKVHHSRFFAMSLDYGNCPGFLIIGGRNLSHSF